MNNERLTFGLGGLIIISILGILLLDVLIGIIGIVALWSYNYMFLSLVLLYITFPLDLWFFGKRNSKNILQGKSNIKTSAEFSFGVNIMIWLVFLLNGKYINL
jgi:uncharacterized membrane protein